jgi:NAD(P)-dependent dehydrogenase (short-subunit alcohol dehydrogenase family)
MTKRLAGKTALVTGAADGLGKAVALRFLAEGARVILTDIQAEKVCSLAAEMGSGVIGLKHDVSSESDWRHVLDSVVKRWGGFDTLVNNAGISVKGDIEHTTFAAWRETCAVDLDGVFLGCHLALPILRKNSAASIVNVSSALAVKAHLEMPAYSAAKAGVEQMTRSMALYCARSGYAIRCNLVQPGSIMTPMQERVLAARGGTRDGQYQKTIDAHPMGRIATPDEVANAILFLASEEASFVTGACLAVDGGLTL